jgi:hypothetical protein
MEEFEKLVAESFQSDLLPAESEQAELPSTTSETQDSEPAQTAEGSELAVIEQRVSGESDPAA